MRFLWLALLVLWPSVPLVAQDDLHPQSGRVELKEARATLNLGDAYSFYGPADARRIIVDIWENPPSEAEGVLGLVMPADTSPREEGWGAIVTWESIGWVASDEARDADYDELLREMQAAVRSGNAQRRADGFSDVQLLGWAQRPVHDSVANTVTWGRELTFFENEPNTLHYDMRVLGRSGVVSMNVVGTMPQLPEVRAAAADLGRRTQFDAGARYSDFDAERDEVAGYGVAGLVATGAGLAVAKNLGAFAVLAKLLQPLGIALLVLAAALATPFRKLFRRREPATR
ncbi:MAG: DUF2167 domain-containing protein [Alteraurantiacibacter sp.]